MRDTAKKEYERQGGREGGIPTACFSGQVLLCLDYHHFVGVGGGFVFHRFVGTPL